MLFLQTKKSKSYTCLLCCTKNEYENETIALIKINNNMPVLCDDCKRIIGINEMFVDIKQYTSKDRDSYCKECVKEHLKRGKTLMTPKGFAKIFVPIKENCSTTIAAFKMAITGDCIYKAVRNGIIEPEELLTIESIAIDIVLPGPVEFVADAIRFVQNSNQT